MVYRKSNTEEISPSNERAGPLLLAEGLVEVDDAFIGVRDSGKRGRGAEGKKPVIFAVEQRK